jgi:hypothetical protein
MKYLRLYRPQVADDSGTIVIDKELPRDGKIDQLYEDDARRLHSLLLFTLPSGTWERLVRRINRDPLDVDHSNEDDDDEE